MRLWIIKFAIFIILTGFHVSSYSQSQHQQKIDSLKELVVKNIDRNSDELYSATLDLAWEYSFDSKFEEAFETAMTANQLAHRWQDTAKIVQSGRLVGQVDLNLGKLIEAEKLFLELLSMAVAKGLENDITMLQNGLAMSYSHQAKYDKALYFFFQSLGKREARHDSIKISTSLINIGFVYYKLKDYKKAIDYYARSLALKYKIGNTYDLDRLLIDLSLCYTFMHQYDSAESYLNKTNTLCNGNCSSQILTEYEYAKGQIAMGRSKIDEAEITFLKSYNLSCEFENSLFQLENLLQLATINNRKNKFPLTKFYLDKAEKIGFDLSYNRLQIEILKQFSFMYENTHNYVNAAKYQAKYIQLRDSIYSEELTQNLMVVQAEYEQRENKAKIESQNKILGLKEQIIKRQNILEIVAVIAIVLLALLILALYRNKRQKKIINATLEQKVQEQMRELEASYALIQKAYSDQNNFIEKAAKDIKGPLSTMKGLCTLGLKEVSKSEAQEYLIQLNEATDQLAGTVRKLASNREV